MFWLGRLGADLLTGGTQGIAATNLVTVATHATALVAVLPSAFGVINPIEPMPLTVPNFEVRGYVHIRLPALFTPPNFVRQNGGNDAKVLLTPQNRATFITAADVLSDRTQAGLPLANGDALNTIAPDELLFFTSGPPASRERVAGRACWPAWCRAYRRKPAPTCCRCWSGSWMRTASTCRASTRSSRSSGGHTRAKAV